MIPITRPDVTFDEVEDDLRRVIDSGWLTNGPAVREFEDAIAAAVGVEHAVTVSSATTGLHLALAAMGIGRGDEVLVSDFSFPASANAVVQTGARPVLVDCRQNAFDLDPAVAASLITPRTRAILPVHPFGQPADMSAIEGLATRHGLLVVEDAACAIGATRDGRAAGSGSGVGCFSFHPRKLVTTGEGGAITTRDAALADRLRRLRSHGGAPASVGLTFLENGYNYRLSDVAASLGLGQLRRLGETLTDRRRTAGRYAELLDGVPGVQLPLSEAAGEGTFQSFVLLLDDAVNRDRVVELMRAAGVETTLGTYAQHAHPAFARFGYEAGQLKNSFRAQQQSLTIPLLPRMSDDDITYVAGALVEAMDGA